MVQPKRKCLRPLLPPNWLARDCAPTAQSKSREISPQDVLVKKRMDGDSQRFLSRQRTTQGSYSENKAKALGFNRDGPRARPPDEVLSRKEVAELQSRLSMMGTSALQGFYRSAHFVCRIGSGHFPNAGDSGAGRRLEAAREMAVAGRWPGEHYGMIEECTAVPRSLSSGKCANLARLACEEVLELGCYLNQRDPPSDLANLALDRSQRSAYSRPTR